MIRVRNLSVIALIYALVTMVSGCAHTPQPPKAIGFTADVVFTDLNGQRQAGSSTEKLYYRNHKIRQDIISHGRTIQILIARRDTGAYWIIMPAKKQYFEQTAVYGSFIQDPSNIENLKKQADVRELGTETVNGYTCRKIRYTWHKEQMGVMTLWIATKLSYPIQTLQESHQKYALSGYTKLKNIKEQAPPDSIFELPRGYKKIPLPENAAPKEKP